MTEMTSSPESGQKQRHDHDKDDYGAFVERRRQGSILFPPRISIKEREKTTTMGVRTLLEWESDLTTERMPQ